MPDERDAYRDLVIEMLADENAALLERVATLDTDVAVYRELTQSTFDALRDTTVRLRRATSELIREREEARALRQQLLLARDEDAA